MPANHASSSLRNPGVLRREPPGKPTASGEIRSRRVRKKCASSFRRSYWEQYQNIVVRTLAGVYVPTRAVVPLMAERKHSNLIAVSSTLARAPYAGSGAWERNAPL